MTVGPAIFDSNVPAFDVAQFIQADSKCVHDVRELGQRGGVEKPDHWHQGLLAARRQRPRRRAADQRYKLAASHSITSSASESRLPEISMPSVLAVCTLMTNSNLLARKMGR